MKASWCASPGVGSFVADRHAHAHPLEIRGIADEIRDRGHVHRAEIVSLERVRAVAELAEDFGIAPRSELYCSLIVHFENDRPIQLEDRYVLPKLAPDYLNMDFSANHSARLPGQGRAAAGSRTSVARRNAGRTHAQAAGDEARRTLLGCHSTHLDRRANRLGGAPVLPRFPL